MIWVFTLADRKHQRASAKPVAERVQKVLARAGLASRREIESWIAAGRVMLNGKPAGLGDRAGATDRIQVDGHPVNLRNTTPSETRVLAYYKEAGEVCTRRDPEGRPTVFAKLPRIRKGQWVAIGRLDLNTTGLLLFTTNGELANRLMHPSGEIEREYAVRVLGQPSAIQRQNMLTGVELDDGPAAFGSIQEMGGSGINHWYHVILKEGRNREVRRLWESQGLTVSRLIRVRFGPYELPRRKRPGHYWDLEPSEIGELMNAVGLQTGLGIAGPKRRVWPRPADPGQRKSRPGARSRSKTS